MSGRRAAISGPLRCRREAKPRNQTHTQKKRGPRGGSAARWPLLLGLRVCGAHTASAVTWPMGWMETEWTMYRALFFHPLPGPPVAICSQGGDRNVAVDLRPCDWDRPRLLGGLRVCEAFSFSPFPHGLGNVRDSRSRQVPRFLFAVGDPGMAGPAILVSGDASRRLARRGAVIPHSHKALRVLIELLLNVCSLFTVYFDAIASKLPCRLNVEVYMSAFTVQPTSVF